MRTFFKLALLVAASLAVFGCAHDHYNIPQEVLEKRVKVVGVAPFMVDADSDIRHPEKGAIVGVVRGVNARNERELIARIKDTGIFYSVRQVEGDPDQLFARLVGNRERRDDAGIIYNKYFFKKDELKRLTSENGLDALMLVTVSGLNRKGKVYASNFLSYLETDFNYLILTAQLLDRDGNVIWEYPNFRQRSLAYAMLFPLQYPDFDEAAANLSEKVDVKYKTVPGVVAAFGKTEASAFGNGTPISTLYAAQFDEILSLLKVDKPLFNWRKEKPAAPSTALAAEAPVSAMVPAVGAEIPPSASADPAATPNAVPAAAPAPAATPAPTPAAPDAIPKQTVVPAAAAPAQAPAPPVVPAPAAAAPATAPVTTPVAPEPAIVAD